MLDKVKKKIVPKSRNFKYDLLMSEFKDETHTHLWKFTVKTYELDFDFYYSSVEKPQGQAYLEFVKDVFPETRLVELNLAILDDLDFARRVHSETPAKFINEIYDIGLTGGFKKVNGELFCFLEYFDRCDDYC